MSSRPSNETLVGRTLMVAFMKRFAPANVVAKEHMLSEAFGGLNSFAMIHGSGPYRPTSTLARRKVTS